MKISQNLNHFRAIEGKMYNPLDVEPYGNFPEPEKRGIIEDSGLGGLGGLNTLDLIKPLQPRPLIQKK